MKCHETELTEGAKNDVGIRVMHMFNAAKAAESEQRADEHQWVKTAKIFSHLRF